MTFPRSCALIIIAALFATAAADAAVFHMREGDPITGAYIGKESDRVVLLDAAGKRRTVLAADILRVDWATLASTSVERKAKRERGRHLKKRRRAASDLVRALEKADLDARPALHSELGQFDEAELMRALDKGLRSRHVHVRDYSYGRLKTFASPGAIVPLLKYTLSGSDPAFRDRTHQTALTKNRDKSRQVYEYVALKAGFDERETALNRIAAIGDPKSVPRLVQLLTYVDMNIRATLVRAKRIREVPVSLSGATNVTIDLPEVELIEVNTSVKVPMQVLRKLEGTTINTLRAVTGVDLGDDTKAWTHWWAEYQKSGARTGPG